jgi:NDP-sugar pyrophosphorylase family protein
MVPETDVLVLAGGLGTRLREVVPDQPKVLAAIHGRPFVYYLLDQVRSAGFRRVIFCVGYKAEQVEAQLRAEAGGLEIVFSREERPLGTAGALGLAAPLIHSEQVLVLNGDSVVEADLDAFLTWHSQSDFAAGLIAVEVPDAARFGTLQIGEGGRIDAFLEKQQQAAPGWINAGVYCMPCARLAAIPHDRAISLEAEVFPTWVRDGVLGAWPVRGRFIDIGTPQSYAMGMSFFARRETGA